MNDKSEAIINDIIVQIDEEISLVKQMLYDYRINDGEGKLISFVESQPYAMRMWADKLIKAINIIKESH